ncbi:MAG TPA: cation-translocating P-type ATPase [Steroidobacteraceae bacterium]|jgi:Ca2+-transporting ATPase|nr:cation-translocating P-type ATPase [Steroidobacteraceae bacterium]
MLHTDARSQSRRGLSGQEAAQRLRVEGPNALPELERRTALRIILEVVREPMFALLLGAGVLYLFIGSRGEAIVLFAFACFSVAIAIIQEGRSERVLEALRDLTSPRALVIRDGEQIRIPGREVVRGDLLVLAEGDRVPADALLISGDDVQADESLLTGESVPVRKRPAPEEAAAAQSSPAEAAPGGDDLPLVFSGTLIVTGGGLAVVTATGLRSEIGKIGHAVTRITPEPPRLQAQTRGFVTGFAIVGLSLSALAVLLYGLLRGAWLQGLLGGIALGMSMLPEEFPLVLTVFMVMGAWRLSRSHVLTRRPAAIETVGAATVLCTDKTGTLTRNLMSVEWLERDAQCAEAVTGSGESRALHPRLQELLATAVLASRPEAVDPMDRALVRLAADVGGGAAGAELVRGYPWLPELPALVQVWRLPGGAAAAAAKGAPEAIATLCRLDAAALQTMRARVEELARRGMRVLAVASAQLVSAPPERALDLPLQLDGLIGFVDPLRAGIPEAVRECRSAGIRVVMITGDHPETARAIAAQAGIEHEGVMTGPELARLDEPSLLERVAQVSVFARITPQQKLRIVAALKARGEVVAMTGDGVNDAPALRSAHIGIAMGQRGTDVAREASALVLLDDDFNSIVRAVRLGRRIYDNLVKAVSYILAIHLPIAGLALVPIAMGRPLVLTPMLIAILELIIDPLCSVVLEAERDERDVMTRPPRDPEGKLLSRPLLVGGFLQGALATLVVCGVFLYASLHGLPSETVRSMGFLTLVGANYALIFANRSFSASPLAGLARPNPSLWISVTAAAGALVAMLLIPAVAGFLHLGPLRAHQVLLCIAAAVVLLGALQGVKLLVRRRPRQASATAL